MPYGEHKLSSGLLDSDVGRLRLKFVSMQVDPLQVAEMKTRRKFVNSTKYHFGNSWQVRRLVWSMPGNSKALFKLRQISADLVLRLFTDEQQQQQ
jgi:hypothetical protein